ncbi:MAG: hypothetical protein WA421_04020 [Nitrososphaeraceae archaeon]
MGHKAFGLSGLAINVQALREVYSNVGFGCFIDKPVSIEYLINRLAAELD